MLPANHLDVRVSWQSRGVASNAHQQMNYLDSVGLHLQLRTRPQHPVLLNLLRLCSHATQHAVRQTDQSQDTNDKYIAPASRPFENLLQLL